MKITIIDYGAGNTQSVRFALQRLGVDPVLSSDREEIIHSEKVIFPGVGHAAAAMKVLREKNLDTLIPELKQPVLGICLGMQLMGTRSEEGDTECLGIFDVPVLRFEPKDKVPHMGWNTAKRHAQHERDAPEGYFYFVHSYYMPVNPHTILACNYITDFSAALRKDNFFAAQFHPEKSGAKGNTFLEWFLKQS